MIEAPLLKAGTSFSITFSRVKIVEMATSFVKFEQKDFILKSMSEYFNSKDTDVQLFSSDGYEFRTHKVSLINTVGYFAKICKK